MRAIERTHSITMLRGRSSCPVARLDVEASETAQRSACRPNHDAAQCEGRAGNRAGVGLRCSASQPAAWANVGYLEALHLDRSNACHSHGPDDRSGTVACACEARTEAELMSSRSFNSHVQAVPGRPRRSSGTAQPAAMEVENARGISTSNTSMRVELAETNSTRNRQEKMADRPSFPVQSVAFTKVNATMLPHGSDRVAAPPVRPPGWLWRAHIMCARPTTANGIGFARSPTAAHAVVTRLSR